MLRERFSAFRQVLMAPPDAPGAAGGSSTPPSTGGSTGSPSAPPSGGAATSGTTPPGSSVAPGVEPPPGAPGSTVGAEGAQEAPDFMSIFGEAPASPVETPPAIVPASTAAPAAAPAPAATPAAVEPPVAAQPAGAGEGGQPPAGTPPASGQGAAAPVLDPYDPSGLATAILQNEQATIDHVAQTMFQLSQEDMQQLEADVGGTVPKLLAKAFVKTQVNSLMQLARIIPEMVKRSMENMKNHTQNEDSFYKAWPQIDRGNPQHVDLVKRYGITYRTMNPQVSKEQMIQDLGPLIMMAAKIPVGAPVATNGTVPAQPQNGARSAPHQPSPFTPALAGAAATVQPQELSEIEAMFAPRD